ncbi:MAG: hypothetical protein K5696_07200 [Lachnospiraceae bacterium]|nr:hypothetical protein [Lachnospiraceae bacterium]
MMASIISLPLEMMWKNSPVVRLSFADTSFFAMMDSGTMMPMYFGNQNVLEKVLNGRVLDEEVTLRGANGKTASYRVVACSVIVDKTTFPNMKMAWLPDSDFQFQFLLSYTMFRDCRIILDDMNGQFEVYAEQVADMYLRTPYIVKGNGNTYSLCTNM